MESEAEKMAHMRMKIPQVAFMPQMAMDESQLIRPSLGDQREMTERRMDESQLISLPFGK